MKSFKAKRFWQDESIFDSCHLGFLLIHKEHLEHIVEHFSTGFLSLKTCVLVKRSCPQWELSTLFSSFIMPGSVADCTASLPDDRDTRSLKLPTPLTLNQPDEWAVSQEVDMHITTSGTPNQAPFSLLSLFFISLSYFSLSLPAVGLSGTDCDTLWHGSQAKLCCASITLTVPQHPDVRQGPARCHAGWLVSTTAWGTPVSLPMLTSV